MTKRFTPEAASWRFTASRMSSKLFGSSGSRSALTPQTSESLRAVGRLGVSAWIGCFGRVAETRWADEPERVKTTSGQSRSSASRCAARAQASAVEGVGGPGRGLGGGVGVAVGFDGADDAVHDGDGGCRVAADGGFGREHDGVGALVDGGGDVVGFGAGGDEGFDHRFEHVRRDDHRLAVGAGDADDAALGDRHLFGREFDAEIAARDHDARPTAGRWLRDRRGRRASRSWR